MTDVATVISVPGTRATAGMAPRDGRPDLSFASHLVKALDAPQRAEQARAVASQFVATAFIQPLLAELRESSRAADPFGPTDAEKRFGPMLDAMVSDRISEAARFPLTDIIAQRLLRSAADATEVIHD